MLESVFEIVVGIVVFVAVATLVVVTANTLGNQVKFLAGRNEFFSRNPVAMHRFVIPILCGILHFFDIPLTVPPTIELGQVFVVKTSLNVPAGIEAPE